jgi:hypothetical protein
VGALAGSAALLLAYLSARGALLLGILVLAAALSGIAYLERAPYERQEREPSRAR